jgi:hypothetical protein
MERLAGILADMLWSALAWEEEHRGPPPAAQNRTARGWTRIRVSHRLDSHQAAAGGKQDERSHNKQENESLDHI